MVAEFIRLAALLGLLPPPLIGQFLSAGDCRLPLALSSSRCVRSEGDAPVEAISSKASSPIRSFSPHPGFARRSSIGVCACVVGLLFAIAQLTGCGVTFNAIPLTVSPSSLSFGSVAVGTTQSATVSVQNQGLSAVTLSGIQAADPAFQLASVSTPATIPARGTATPKVCLCPPAQERR